MLFYLQSKAIIYLIMNSLNSNTRCTEMKNHDLKHEIEYLRDKLTIYEIIQAEKHLSLMQSLGENQDRITITHDDSPSNLGNSNDLISNSSLLFGASPIEEEANNETLQKNECENLAIEVCSILI